MVGKVANVEHKYIISLKKNRRNRVMKYQS